MSRKSFLVERSGARLDAFLAEGLACSRAEARRLLGAGEVHVNGRRRGPDAKGETLAVGARVEIDEWVPPEARRPVPEPQLPLPVLAEGAGWVVVDKPPGMPVHPLAVGERGTALNAVIARHPEVAGVGEGGLRSGVVHRLDVDTSGALAVATAEDAFLRLRSAFREGRMEKVYRAIASGELRGSGEISLSMAVAQHRPARVAVAGRGRPVRMSWHALEPLRDATLLEVRPQTGFLHQIRAAFAHLGHPLVGDVHYGAAASGDTARHLLHASRLAGVGLVAESPDAADFAAALGALRS